MDFGVSVKYASIRHKLLRYAVRWTMKWWLLASGYKLENNGLLCGNSSSCLELQRSCLQNDNSTIVFMCTMPYDQWLCTSRRKAWYHPHGNLVFCCLLVYDVFKIHKCMYNARVPYYIIISRPQNESVLSERVSWLHQGVSMLYKET